MNRSNPRKLLLILLIVIPIHSFQIELIPSSSSTSIILEAFIDSLTLKWKLTDSPTAEKNENSTTAASTANIQLALVRNNNIQTTTIDSIPHNYRNSECDVELKISPSVRSGQIHFPCPCFVQAGQYHILPVVCHTGGPCQNESKPLAELTVEWPRTLFYRKLALPETHLTLNGPVILSMDYSDDNRQICTKLTVESNLEIIYVPKAEMTKSKSEYNVVQRLPLLPHDERKSQPLDCTTFNREGFYAVQVAITYKYNSDDTDEGEDTDKTPQSSSLWPKQFLYKPGQTQMQKQKKKKKKMYFRPSRSRSNWMETGWNSKAYEILMNTESIRPCSDDKVTISFNRPSDSASCPIEGDRIRLYAIHRKHNQRGMKGPPTRLVYQKEAKIYPTSTSISFSCASNFDTINPGYCFKYVSVLPGGIVREWTSKCVRTEARAHLPINGAWSSWDAWKPCSASCDTGIQQRVRACDNPSPLYGGHPCPGDVLQTRTCNRQICPVDNKSLGSKSRCSCGCRLEKPSIIVIHSHRCPQNLTSVWTIVTPEARKDGAEVPKLRFRLLTAQFSPSDSLRIRDGLRSNDPLITTLTSNNLKPQDIYQARSGRLRIEHETTTRKSPKERKTSDKGNSNNDGDWLGGIIQFVDNDNSYGSSLLAGSYEEEDEEYDTVYSMDLYHLGIIIGLIVAIIVVLIVSGWWFWCYTHRKLMSNSQILMSQSLITTSLYSTSNNQQQHNVAAAVPSSTANGHDRSPQSRSEKSRHSAAFDVMSTNGGSKRISAISNGSTSLSPRTTTTIHSHQPQIHNHPNGRGGDVMMKVNKENVPLLLNDHRDSRIMTTSAVTKSSHMSTGSSSSTGCGSSSPGNNSPPSTNFLENKGKGKCKDEDQKGASLNSTIRQNPAVNGRRSIGIQLNSPALPLKRYTSIESRMSAQSSLAGGGLSRFNRDPNFNTTGSASRTPSIGGPHTSSSIHGGQQQNGNGNGSPTISFVGTEEQDFEYDYYEPNIPGSYLIPPGWLNGCEMQSEIDIEEIIGDSELMRTPTRLLNPETETTASSDPADQQQQLFASKSTQILDRDCDQSAKIKCDIENYLNT